MPTHSTLDESGKVPLDQLPPGGPGGAAWGGISGTLEDQADLAASLAGKETSGAATAAVAAHEGASDPHPGYLTLADGTAAFDAAGSAAAAQAASLPLHGKADTAGAADTAAALSAGADRTKLDAITGTNTGDQTLAGLGGVPTTRTVAGKALSSDVTLAKGDVGLGSVDNTADTAKVVASAAVLTTPRTINGTSFNGSADINAVPTWRCGQTTKNLADASTTQNIAHGLGRVPKAVRILGRLAFSAGISMECNAFMCDASQSGSAVIWSEGTSTAVADTIYQSTAAALGFSNAAAVNPFTGATKHSGVITADATNIIITWTKTGSPTGTANLAWECT